MEEHFKFSLKFNFNIDEFQILVTPTLTRQQNTG
jgi:hypothetical protein